jgi:hypothetical protein
MRWILAAKIKFICHRVFHSDASFNDVDSLLDLGDYLPNAMTAPIFDQYGELHGLVFVRLE